MGKYKKNILIWSWQEHLSFPVLPRPHITTVKNIILDLINYTVYSLYRTTKCTMQFHRPAVNSHRKMLVIWILLIKYSMVRFMNLGGLVLMLLVPLVCMLYGMDGQMNSTLRLLPMPIKL